MKDLRQEPIPYLQQERKVRQESTGDITSEPLGIWDLDLLAEEGGQVFWLLLGEKLRRMDDILKSSGAVVDQTSCGEQTSNDCEIQEDQTSG